MTKDEAKREIERLASLCGSECREAYKKAKESGTLRPGLDSNKDIYAAINAKYKPMIVELSKLVCGVDN